MRGKLILFLCLIFGMLWLSPAVLSGPRDDPHEHMGKIMFEKECVQCHNLPKPLLKKPTLKERLEAPLGLAALFSLTAALLLAFYIKKNRKVILPWHRRAGYAALVLAGIHAFISIFLK